MTSPTPTLSLLRQRPPKRRRWTRAEFARAESLGLFRADERLELLDGEIVEKEPRVNTPHAAAQRKAEKLLARLFAEGYDVRGQLPLALGARSQPLSDIAIVTGSEDDYLTDHPQNAILVMEISDTTLRTDRQHKLQIYAKAQIADYWILNLVERQLEIYRRPQPSESNATRWHYAEITIYTETETVKSLALPKKEIFVASLLPPRLTE